MTELLLLTFALFSAIIMALSLYWNNWPTKFVALMLFVILANCVYFSLDGVKGWPAPEPTEIKGTIASVVIVNPSSDDEGAIYIGVFLSETKRFEYKYNRIAPKTFYVRYSNSRAAQFEKVLSALKEGQEVRINGMPPMEGQSDGEPYDGEVSNISEMIGRMLERLMPKQKDTYQPTAPADIEIVGPSVPPQKGS